MKLSIFAVAIVLLCSAFVWIKIGTGKVVTAQEEALNGLSQNITVCGSLNNDEYIPGSITNDFPLLDGWDFHLPISTKSDSAQIYFNQGLVLYYSYHNQEAKASFKKAQTFDATCAMLFWGEAMCHNKYVFNQKLNQPAIADSLIKIAQRYMEEASSFERALVNAGAILLNNDRVSDEAESGRLKLYESATEKLYKDFPDNADAAGAFIGAVYWNNKRSEEEIKRLFVSMLKKFPGHPYLNHLFIHFIESIEPRLALSSAANMLERTPGISHMVHMASHIYVHTGNYQEGVEVNEKARELFSGYMKLYPALSEGAGPFAYLAHPLGMELANAVNMPYYEAAEKIAYAHNRFANSLNETRLKRGLKKINPKHLGAQMDASVFDWVRIRYGKWDEIMAENAVPDSIKFKSYMQHFAKGMALARTGRYRESESHLKTIQHLIQDPFFKDKPSFDTLSTYLRIAIPMLKAVLEEEQGHYKDAEKFYNEAIVFEDALKYDDPTPWFIAVRPFLGNSLVRSGDYARAEEIFKADLEIHPDNYWSLRGLMLASQKQKKKEQSVLIRNKIKNLYTYSGIEPKGAVY